MSIDRPVSGTATGTESGTTRPQDHGPDPRRRKTCPAVCPVGAPHPAHCGAPEDQSCTSG